MAFSFNEQAPQQQRKTVTASKVRTTAMTSARGGRTAAEEIQVGMWYKVFKDLSSVQRKEWNVAMEATIGQSGLVKAVNATNGTVRVKRNPAHCTAPRLILLFFIIIILMATLTHARTWLLVMARARANRPC
jgi:hypothetical protein